MSRWSLRLWIAFLILPAAAVMVVFVVVPIVTALAYSLYAWHGSARSDSLGRVVLDAAVIALCTNAANLFDRAPGRTVKVSLFVFLVLVGATRAPAELLAVAVVAGAATGLLWPDLREQMMLGDVGANVLGGVIGLGVVIATAPTTRTIVLLGVLALNLASEAVSFSKVIDRVGPLRVLDRAGRRP